MQRSREVKKKYQEAQRITELLTVSQTILARPGNEMKPIKEQEFAELRIDDWTESYRPGFAVREWSIRWSKTDQGFMWEDEKQELWSTLQTARNRFQARLQALDGRALHTRICASDPRWS